jgi:hypothetical protein
MPSNREKKREILNSAVAAADYISIYSLSHSAPAAAPSFEYNNNKNEK